MECFQRSNSQKGFTLVEILAVLAILGVLAASAIVALSTLRGGSDLQAEARGFSRVLELAKSKTIASQGDTRYGVYVDMSTSPHQYVLFQTETDYASGVAQETYELRDVIEFESASFAGLSGQEVVFDRIQGTTSQVGSAVLRTKANPSNTVIVSVESSGNVEIGSSISPGDDGNCDDDPDDPPGDRVCDSRHVHVSYKDYILPRIDTATEEILLDFENNGTPDATIVIADHLSGGQILWEDTIDIGGEDQHIKLHTHQLNDGAGLNETVFSIHRDRGENTKALTIIMSADSAPFNTLISYDALGIITPGTSIYVKATQEQ